MMYLKTCFLIFILSFLSFNSFAEGEFYRDKERGWYYFEHKINKETNQKVEQDYLASPANALTQLEHIQQSLEFKKAKLVLYPTIENAKDFMAFQKAILDNASNVSKVWQAALLKYPYLNEQLEHPVNSQAIRIKYEEENKETDIKISEFARHFELLYFFKSDCAYCNSFTPVLKEFAKEYQFKVRAISIDNKNISEFKTEANQALVEDLKVTITPTVIAYSRTYDMYVPIAYGFQAIDELKRNVINVYNNIVNLSMEAR